MDILLKISFQELLNAVHTLTPAQKTRLRQELGEEKVEKNDKSVFIEMLLKGPAFSENEFRSIEDSHESIAK